MAIGKPRGNYKRPYGGSCTITTVLLATVCVFGIWRLIITSNSTTSPSNTTTLQIKQYDSSMSSFVKLNRKIPIDHATTKDKLLVDHLSVYNNTSNSDQDGLIQHDDDDDESKAQANLDTLQEMGQNNNPDDDDNLLAEPETEPKQESTSSDIIIDDDADSLNDSDVGKQEAEQHQEEAKEEQDIEISTLLIEDDQSQAEKTSTKQQHAHKPKNIKETNDDDHQQTDDSGNQEDKLIEDDIRDLEDNQDQQDITDDQEHEKGIENQQEQNEDDGPIESHSIAAETKARVENQEALDIRNKMEQAKIESTIANTTIPIIKASNVEYSTHVPKFDNIISESDKWELCNVTTGTDYIPCLDSEIAIRNSHHYERHCPNEPPVCLVPLPEAYTTPIPWPQSRDKIWLHNVPNKALSDLKQLQNSVKVTGEFITFPKGALHHIDFLQEAVPEITWGNHTRVVLDVGCGVASFGGYLFDKDVLAMSIASQDEQEAQIQFALERGIPAVSSVIESTQRLPFPSRVFDLVHCVHCKVPWHKDGGILLLEVNRVLRPGGNFVWSATPVYRTLEEDVQVWKEMSALTVAMCWELVTIKKDKLNAIGVAVYHKPESNECYNVIKKQQPPMCKPDDDPNYAWYVTLQTCMHMVPMKETERGSHWPEAWPSRIQKPPYWLNESQVGIYGKPAPNDFKQDYEHWKRVISKSYMSDLGINWSNVRNVMDMRAVYGGFAAALKDLKLWVLNVVNVDSPDSDTLAIIFERGLVGIYHDWCESFSTYPRTYDLLHADHLFSNLKNRCKIKAVIAEIDRILRPGGNLIVRDEPSIIREMENLLKSLYWEVNLTFTNEEEGVISSRKSLWRPTTYVTPS